MTLSRFTLRTNARTLDHSSQDQWGKAIRLYVHGEIRDLP
jgi:hypothetical protein